MRRFFLTFAIAAVGCASKAHVAKKDMLLVDPHAAAPRSAVYKPKKGKAVVPRAPVATPTSEDVAKRIARNSEDFASKPPQPPWYKQLLKGPDHYHVGIDCEKGITIEGCNGEKEAKEKKEQEERDERESERIASSIVKPGSGGGLSRKELEYSRCVGGEPDAKKVSVSKVVR